MVIFRTTNTLQSIFNSSYSPQVLIHFLYSYIILRYIVIPKPGPWEDNLCWHLSDGERYIKLSLRSLENGLITHNLPMPLTIKYGRLPLGWRRKAASGGGYGTERNMDIYGWWKWYSMVYGTRGKCIVTQCQLTKSHRDHCLNERPTIESSTWILTILVPLITLPLGK